MSRASPSNILISDVDQSGDAWVCNRLSDLVNGGKLTYYAIRIAQLLGL